MPPNCLAPRGSSSSLASGCPFSKRSPGLSRGVSARRAFGWRSRRAAGSARRCPKPRRAVRSRCTPGADLGTKKPGSEKEHGADFHFSTILKTPPTVLSASLSTCHRSFAIVQHTKAFSAIHCEKSARSVVSSVARSDACPASGLNAFRSTGVKTPSGRQPTDRRSPAPAHCSDASRRRAVRGDG